jgi:hypothetical protein
MSIVLIGDMEVLVPQLQALPMAFQPAATN